MDITLPQSLFTVQDLTSLAGLVVAVYVIVSFIKEPLKTLTKGDWIVRPVTVLVALAIMLWLIFIQGAVTSETIGLAVINSFLVALIAGAAHDYIVAPTKAKADQKQIAAEQAQLDIMGIGQTGNTTTQMLTTIKTGDRGEEPPSTNL